TRTGPCPIVTPSPSAVAPSGRRLGTAGSITGPSSCGAALVSTQSSGRSAVVAVAVLVAMTVRIVRCTGSALTGRVGWHSTTGLAVVSATSLASAQLDQGVGHGHPQLDPERGVITGPVGNHRPAAGLRPGFLIGLC